MSTNSEVLAKKMKLQTWSADQYLAGCTQDKDRPFYSEESLDRRQRYAIRRAIETGYQFKLEESKSLKSKELRELVRYAKLTYRQYDVLMARLNHESFASIGKRWRKTKQAAQQSYAQMLRKLEKAAQNYPFVGLTEVYQSETKRGR